MAQFFRGRPILAPNFALGVWHCERRNSLENRQCISSLGSGGYGCSMRALVKTKWPDRRMPIGPLAISWWNGCSRRGAVQPG